MKNLTANRFWLGALITCVAAGGAGACGDDSGGGDGNNTANDNNGNNINNTGNNNNTADPCDPNPCQNGGGCNGSGSGYTCDCPSGWTGMHCETPEGQPQPSMGTDVSVIFLHHSTGGVIWDGGVETWFTEHNQANSTTHTVIEQAFPKSSPYGWQNYPYDYWNIWVEHAGATPYMEEPTLEMLTRQYDVIVFKHCFPVSHVQPDTGSPDITSQTKSRENYELQYEALKQKLLEFPDNRFIVWTGAALVEGDTNAEEAGRARDFFDWVKNVWDEPGDNIYVWDFWQLETEGGLYLLPRHSAGDSHPDATFAQAVAPFFGRRIADVIDGYGDLGGLTGQ